MVNQSLLNQLLNAGYTQPAENIPALYKCGMGFDSESTTISHTELRGKKKPKEITIVDSCFCYAWQYAFNKEYGHIVRTKTAILGVIQEVIDTVKAANKINDTNAIYIIWCANLAHEWSFIKSEIANYFEVTKAFAKSPRDVLYVQLEKCVEFRECIGLFGSSLADIAKKWCSADNQKLVGELDYNKIRHCETELKDEIPYMIHDVTTLAEMHENVIKAHLQDNGVCRLPYTSSGFVRMDLKDSIRNDEELTALRTQYNEKKRKKKQCESNIEYLKKINYKCVTDIYQWTTCREYGYSGGLCGSNIKLAGKILNNVVCADLTSDYPAQLSHKKYPYGELKEVKAGNLNDVRKLLDKKHVPYFAVLKIKTIKAKTQHATFSKHKIMNFLYGETQQYHGAPKDLICYNGKVYSGKNLIVCWNDVDIKAYKELYDIKAGVLTLWKFVEYRKLPQWFLKPLWSAYQTKAELKTKGIKSGNLYDQSKRMVNSIYGVCATRVNDSYDTLDYEYNFKVGNEKDFDKIRRDFWLNPYIAFYCTSYARAILMHFLARFPNAIVQYDTDSLYYLKDSGKELEKALTDYNEEIAVKNRRIFRDMSNPLLFETLGQWDFDDVYKKFIGMGAKKYIKQEQDGTLKTVIAGLPKGAIPKEIEETGIDKPFDYYNPLVKWLCNEDNKIIIKHAFAGKFASVYGDSTETQLIDITDYKGITAKQDVSTYHAIIPIDFTLSMAIEYIKQILRNN